MRKLDLHNSPSGGNPKKQRRGGTGKKPRKGGYQFVGVVGWRYRPTMVWTALHAVWMALCGYGIGSLQADGAGEG